MRPRLPKKYCSIAALLIIPAISGYCQPEYPAVADSSASEIRLVSAEERYSTSVFGHPIADKQNDSLKTLPIDKKNFLTKRAVGRFNRGITNYLFIPKKQWMFGLSASYANFDSKDSRMLLSLLKDFDMYGYTVKINPYAGYFYTDNQCAGVKLGYSRTLGRLDNLSLNIDDLDLSLKDMYLLEDMFTGTIFHRSYVGLDTKGRFAVFNETTFSVGYGTTRFERGKDENEKDTRTTILDLQLGINPGFSVFITNNVSTEVSFGVAGLKYRKEKQKTNQTETGSHNTGGANFKINLFNINIGLTIHI